MWLVNLYIKIISYLRCPIATATTTVATNVVFIAADPGAHAPQLEAATLHDVTEAVAGVANVLQTDNDACPEAVAGVANGNDRPA